MESTGFRYHGFNEYALLQMSFLVISLLLLLIDLVIVPYKV